MKKGFRIDHLFPSHVTGIVTMGDRFIVDENRERLKERLRFFKENNVDESWLNKKFALGKNYARWILKNKSSITIDEAKLAQLAYRPFDTRWTYFDNKFIWRWRADTMRHFLKGENAGLVFRRQSPEGKDIYIFVSNTITADGYIRSDNKGGESAAPLYLYPESDEVQSADAEQKRIPNLNREIAARIAKGIDLRFTPEKKEDAKGTFAPIDILDYVYAVLHSPAYRQKYKEFLKIDFPRVPYPKNAEIFRHLVHFGTELRQIHLLEHPKTAEFVTAFPQNGSNAVEKIRWDSGKVWINKKQRFENVAQPAWEFCIGGYRPAQKWLKDRKGRILTSQDIEHCHKIIAALKETHRIMGEIDRTIEKYGETKIRTD
ncbi:MAG: type ISP restriction/modification enzyme [Desulfobacterales bacterium]